MYALAAETGEVKRNFAVKPDCGEGRKERVPTCWREFGLSAAPAVIDGAVVTASVDGYLYVLDGKTGKLFWKYDTAVSYHGVNGVAGKGGAIESAAFSAGGGYLFVNSGYSMFGQTPGNVFLAFRPKRQP